MSRPLINLTSQRFGRLAVLHRESRDGHGNPTWKCVCLCGNVVVVRGMSLRRGHTTSCGCLRMERCRKVVTYHGMARSSEYRAWEGMVQRTGNPRYAQWKDYGGRGIDMNPEWKGEGGFKKFLACVGPKPDPSYSIDRIDNDRGYWPENIRWADRKTQQSNRRVCKT